MTVQYILLVNILAVVKSQRSALEPPPIDGTYCSDKRGKQYTYNKFTIINDDTIV